MGGYIYYKGDKYGSGEDSKLKAINIDRFLENNFETDEERLAFIDDWNQGGATITKDNEGYVLVPASNDMWIENAVMVDTQGDGIKINTDPEIIKVRVNNGVERIYSNESVETCILEGLRWFILPVRQESLYTNASQTQSINRFVAPTSQSVLVEQACENLEEIEDRTPEQELDLISLTKLKNFINDENVNKYIYQDFIYLGQNTSNTTIKNVGTAVLYSVYFKGIDSSGHYTYSLAEKQHNLNWRDDSYHPFEYGSIVFSEKPDIVGIVPILHTVNLLKEPQILYSTGPNDETLVSEKINENKYFIKYSDTYLTKDIIKTNPNNGTLDGLIINIKEGAFMICIEEEDNKAIFYQVSDSPLVRQLSSSSNGNLFRWYWIGLKKQGDNYKVLRCVDSSLRNNFSSTMPVFKTEYSTLQSLTSKTQPVDWEEKARDLYGIDG